MPSSSSPKPDRKERLAEQLRANLKKRKQQMRAREALAGEEKSDGTTLGDRPENAPQSDPSLVGDG